MPLDYTAKLSDIISALEDMQAVNAKADLSSVVGAPATSNDTVASINSVIQTAKNNLADAIGDSVSNTDPLLELSSKLTNYKNFATGEILAGAQMNFLYTGSGQVLNYSVTTNGLSFKPSTIILEAIRYDVTSHTILFPTFFDTRNETLNRGRIIVSKGHNSTTAAINAPLNYVRLEGNAYVNETGFQLPVTDNVTYKFYAFS